MSESNFNIPNEPVVPEKAQPEVEAGQKLEEIPSAELIAMPPKDLADYLTNLAEAGTLESFFEKAAENPALVAHLSYWEKWLQKDQQKLLEDIIAKKKEIYPPTSESLPLGLEKMFTKQELVTIFSNVKAIQLTFGCSKGCAFCGFDAIKGAREHIPYSELVNMFKEYGALLHRGRPFLYWASEPSDYASKEGLEDRTYQDVHQLAIEYAGYEPGVTSLNFDKEWLEFMAKKMGDFPKRPQRRLSVFGMNEETVKKIRLRVLESESKARNEGAKTTTVQMFGAGPSSSDPETIFVAKHLKGMGTSFDENTDDGIPKSGIACVDGVLLTPRGLFSTFVVPISREYPQGAIIIPLEEITDEPIKAGDNLSDILRRAVVDGKFAHKGEFNEGDTYQKYVGAFPKMSIIHTKNDFYEVYVDEKGTIIEAYSNNETNKIQKRLKESEGGTEAQA